MEKKKTKKRYFLPVLPTLSCLFLHLLLPYSVFQLLFHFIFIFLLSAASLPACCRINSAGKQEEQTGGRFSVSFPWRGFSLNYLLNGLKGLSFNMRGCACQHLCVLCAMARYGAFSSISHMTSLPKACDTVDGGRKRIKMVLSLCSSTPPLPAATCTTHTLSHTRSDVH